MLGENEVVEEVYDRLGNAKSHELAMKSYGVWSMLGLGERIRNAQVRGVVQESIARDFIREFLPPGLGIKSGLVFDAAKKKMSPQIDAIIYRGVPLLEFTDAVVVQKEQVKAVFEIKTFIAHTAIFGRKTPSGRKNPDTGLAREFRQRKDFLPEGAKYILFAFELRSGSEDSEILERMKAICDCYGILIRRASKTAKKAGKESQYNFDKSVSKLIKWLRDLS